MASINEVYFPDDLMALLQLHRSELEVVVNVGRIRERAGSGGIA